MNKVRRAVSKAPQKYVLEVSVVGRSHFFFLGGGGKLRGSWGWWEKGGWN